MGYSIMEKSAYGPRPGLEGPFHYPSGRVLYYDAREGAYWDPRTDFYLDQDEVMLLQNQWIDLLKS